LLTKLGIVFLILLRGNFSPIVPVHANNISFNLISLGYSSSKFCFSVNFLDKSLASSLMALKPGDPVKAFAFLVFISKALNFLDFIF